MSNHDFQAVELFNSIKDQYNKQIKVLTTLKQEVTRSEKLDQGQKSALRIQIESVLIDINEEIFAISEELSAAFQMTKSEKNSTELFHKAQEFEQKKIRLLSQIKKSISNNPSTLLVKGDLESEIGASPPQKESTVMEIIRKYSNSNERISKNKSPQLDDYVNLRTVRNKNHDSVETFGNTSTPSIEIKKKFGKISPSPRIPLRNRNNLDTPDMQFQKRSTSRNNSKSSKLAGDNRSSKRSISKSSLNTKMALNQMYSMKKPKNKRNVPKLLPKFSGCGPGGINSSIMVLNRESSDAGFLTIDHRRNNPINHFSIKKQNSHQDMRILQTNDQILKKARQETHKLNSRPASSLTVNQPSGSALSNHYLEIKQNQSFTLESKGGLTETSEAVVQFSRDFDLMRKKFGEMNTKMKDYQENITKLNSQVNQLRDENIKLNSDIKVIRNEHSEMLHTVYKLEQKNQQLVKENEGLKEQLGVEMPQKQIDMPLKQNQQHRTFQQIIESPFSSVMQKKNQQIKTAAFPTVQHSSSEWIKSPPIIQSPKVNTFISSNQSEVKNENDEEQLSDWVLQRLQGLKV